MPSIHSSTPLPPTFLGDLTRHVRSVQINKKKAEQLRPTLERRSSTSTLSECRSSISPPPYLDCWPPGWRGDFYNGNDPLSFQDYYQQNLRVDSPFIDLSQPHQVSIMTKNGIFNLYVDHAQRHIDSHEQHGTTSKISRARVEYQLLSVIDDAVFPVEYKMCWNKAILCSKNFESFWLDKTRRLKLPSKCTERYRPEETLAEYEIPNMHESSADSSSPSNSTPPKFPSPDPDDAGPGNPQLATPISEDDDEEYEDDEVSSEAAALARQLGGEDTTWTPRTSSTPNLDPRGAIGLDINGLSRETGDDGAWGRSKKKSPKTKKTSKSAQAKPSASKSTSKAKSPSKSHINPGTKRNFAKIANEVDSHGTPSKKPKKIVTFNLGGSSISGPSPKSVPVKKGGKSAASCAVGANGTSGAGRQRKKTEKAKVVETGS